MSINLSKIRQFRNEDLQAALQSRDRDIILNFLNEYGLELRDGTIKPKGECIDIWNQYNDNLEAQSQATKILMNSLYGALLNEAFRYYDQRMGQSVTLSGRNVTRHMCAKTNEMLIGEYNHEGDCIIGGDTDSAYFTAYPALKDEIDRGEICWEPEDYIEIYNNIAKEVSSTFSGFLKDTFNVPVEKSDGVIASNREIVAKSAIFIKKKRYAALMVDKEGIRYDVNGKAGKIKVVGLDLRRSDTPKFMQEFLLDILGDTLELKGEDYVIERVRNFKIDFASMEPWKKGTPKSVNKITHYNEMLEQSLAAQLDGRHVPIRVPGHVQAGINWNYLRLINGDMHSPKIANGTKSIVCKLVETPDNMYSSIAYPTDILHLPTWFTDLPFDEEAMEEAIVDKKVSNLLGVLKWDLSRTKPQAKLFESLFGF